MASHRKLVDILKTPSIDMFTHKSKEEGSCKIFILNKDTSPDWISNELTALGYTVRFVCVVRNRTLGEAYHGFAVHLDKTSN